MRPNTTNRIALFLLCVFGAPALLGQGLHWAHQHDHGDCHRMVSSVSCCHHIPAAAQRTKHDDSPRSAYATGECQICRFLATSKQPGKVAASRTTSQPLQLAEPVADEPIVAVSIDALFAPRGPPISG